MNEKARRNVLVGVRDGNAIFTKENMIGFRYFVVTVARVSYASSICLILSYFGSWIQPPKLDIRCSFEKQDWV